MSQDSHAAKPTIVTDPFTGATKVGITLHGREYHVTCGANETKRLEEIVRFVDMKMADVADNNDNVSETRLFMLACLMMADELLEIKRKSAETRRADEDLFVAAVDHLRERVSLISQQLSGGGVAPQSFVSRQ